MSSPVPPFAERSKTTNRSPPLTRTSSLTDLPPTTRTFQRNRNNSENSNRNSPPKTRSKKTEEQQNNDKKIKKSKNRDNIPVDIPATKITESTETQNTRTEINENVFDDFITLSNDTMANDKTSEIFSRINTYVPEFKGADSNDVPSALTRFISLAEWARKSMVTNEEKETFDFLLKYRLVDDAFRRTQYADIKDFDDLKKNLQQLYNQMESLEEIRTKCFTCQQRHIESTVQYGQRITDLFQEYKSCYERKYDVKPDAASEKDLNEQAMTAFKRGLRKSHLKSQIAMIRTDSLTELIQEAIIIERLLKINDADMADGMNITPYQLQAPISIPLGIRCEYCNIAGHTFEVCRKRLQSNQNNLAQQINNTAPPYKNQNFQNRVKIYIRSCSFCMINGHDITECRRKQDMERQYQNSNPQQFNGQQQNQMQQGMQIIRQATPYQSQNNSENYSKPFNANTNYKNQPQGFNNNANYKNYPQTFNTNTNYRNQPQRFNENNNFANQQTLPTNMTNFENQNTNRNPVSFNNQIICRYCKKPGHYEKNCRYKPNTQQNPNDLTENFNNMKICYVNQEDEQQIYATDLYENEYSENYQGSDEN